MPAGSTHKQWHHPSVEDWGEPFFGGGDWRVFVQGANNLGGCVLFVRHGTPEEIRLNGADDRDVPVPDDVRQIVEEMKADPWFRPHPDANFEAELSDLGKLNR